MINPRLIALQSSHCYSNANAKSLVRRPTMRKQRADDQKRMLGTAPIQPLMPLQSYQVELPQDLLDEQGQLLDWVIGYAFDTLAEIGRASCRERGEMRG